MTDITKYRNVSLTHDTYKVLKEDKKEVNIHQCWKCGSKGEIHGISLENSHIFDDDDYWNYIPNHVPKLK